VLRWLSAGKAKLFQSVTGKSAPVGPLDRHAVIAAMIAMFSLARPVSLVIAVVCVAWTLIAPLRTRR
jgi:hypothetical protein